MPKTAGPWLTDELIARATEIRDRRHAAGRSFGPVSLAKELDITRHKAQVVLDVMSGAVERPDAKEQERDQLQLRIAELEQELARMKTAKGRMKIVADAMAKEIHKLPKIKLEKYRRNIDKSLDPEDVVIVISDVHVGSWVSAEATGQLGNYSYEVFVKRLDRLIAAVFSILAYMPHKVEKIHVVFAGDIVDGGRIFRGHARQTDLTVAQQVIKAYEHFAHLVAVLAGIEGVEVVVSTVPGNHGRIGDKGELSPTDNFDWLVGWFLQERFANLGVKNVRFNLPDTWWMLLKVRNTAFHVSHGDAFRSWNSVPFYGALRYKQKIRELLRETFAKTGDGEPPDLDAIICGHHHELAFFGGIYMNGTFVGGSEYSLKDLQVGGPPHQLMLGVHDTYGVSWSRKLFLADPRNKPEVPIYS